MIMADLEERRQGKKKRTIFIIFLIPLIVIMLIQSIITIGTLVTRRITGRLEEFSSSMMSRLVENRKVILQNDMNQRWASVHEQEAVIAGVLDTFLKDNHLEVDELLDSEERKEELLGLLFPECMDILNSHPTTGLFLILTGRDMQGAADFNGFFIRDSDPYTNPVNGTDLLLERGSKLLSREWSIPLDTSWTTRFHMDGEGKTDSDRFFYEPWRAGTEYADADTVDLGYWSLPFSIEKEMPDSYEMITYSVPLRHEGMVYGVLGVEISSRVLYDYFPVTELNDSQQSGYLLAVSHGEGSYRPLVGKGLLYNLVRSLEEISLLEDKDGSSLFRVKDVRLEKQDVYAVVSPLKLYSNNVPYEDTEWVLMGLDTEEDLFGISQQLYIWMVAAILVGLAFGVFGIYFMVRHLTRPVQHLMQCISGGSEGLRGFRPSNILEIDALYDVVKKLTDSQKEAENVLQEEKERYRMALESSRDVFFSYEFQGRIMDIVNHPEMNGRWQCGDTGNAPISRYNIHEDDREMVMKSLYGGEDRIATEFRMRWSEKTEYFWVALTGKAVYDTDGIRRKLIGSIRDIQEQKEREAEQLRKNATDGITGLSVFSVGMQQLQDRWKRLQEDKDDGVMVNLFLSRLKESNEKNGIVFGDMILEELGCLIRSCCERLAERTRQQTVSFRLDGDDFILWLENLSRTGAEEFTEDLLDRFSAGHDREMFNVEMFAGLASRKGERNPERLVCKAKKARKSVISGLTKRYAFYEDLPGNMQGDLPVLNGREVNSIDYRGGVDLISIALNLFGKGVDFPAQMTLMTRKIGRFYEAEAVLVSVLRADFNASYLEYQWHENGVDTAESVRKYKEEDRKAFCEWLGEEEIKYFSGEESRQEILQCFLGAVPGQEGLALPMYDNGNYMGNICILGIGPQILENVEAYHDLGRLGRVVQVQLNQQQHDIASKAKSEFLSRMSHEIRTPMNGIIGMTAIALQQDQGQERILDCLQKIQSSSNYLLGLINDILDMSKIESGKMKLEPVTFSIHEMLDTIRELIAPQAASRGIAFGMDIGIAREWFVADRMRISQVLINLLGNAVKFTPRDGSVVLSVKENKAVGDGIPVSFAVRDTGTGIAKEDQDRVFRSFEQASGRNPAKQQGTGLGLSISSRLIQMMGSNINLESELGKGSTFSFTILMKPGENQEAEEQEESFSFEGYRILVVEDNEINSEIARCLLEERGFEVDCVFDGAQAVERISGTEPGTYDMILMDILMPVMDGLEATRRIRGMERRDCHTIPIVAMSANAFDDDLKKSVECGMNGHLSKPVEVEKLYRTLNEVIHGKDRKQ